MHPSAPPATAPPRIRPSRRLWLAAPLLLLLALLGWGLAAWLGRARLSAQIAALVAHEDAQSRLGAVEAVLALQADDVDWRAQRALEASLGLPAPLPAPNLLPTGDPAEVIGVRPLGGGLYVAVVRRRFSDSAGQVFAFTLPQRYRRLAAGQWQRLPPEPALDAPATQFEGAWLSVIYPVSELEWLRPALAEADRLLAEACAGWQTCPVEVKLPLVIGGAPLPPPALPWRPPAGTPGGHAIILDLPALPPGPAGRIDWPAPALAGRPADAPAQAAYIRALSASLLGHLAALVSGAPRAERDYFLDAVVAHAETRLGLSDPAPGAGGWQPYDFVSPESLWSQAASPFTQGPAAALPQRAQVAELLRLADPDPAQEGRLLLSLRRGALGGFNAWLTASLGAPALERAQAAWRANVQAALATPAPPDWTTAEGLTLVCGEGVSVVRGGQPRLVLAAADGAAVLRAGERLFAEHRLYPEAWSPDGRYLALTAVYPPRSAAGAPTIGLIILDGDTGQLTALPRAAGVFALGWSARGEAVYVRYAPEAGAATGLSLFAYDPASGENRDLLPDAVRLFSLAASSWSADHAALALTLSPTPPGTSAAIITFGAAPQVRALGEPGHGFAPVFAPGSTAASGRAAYLVGAQAGFPGGPWELRVMDLETQAVTTVLSSADLPGREPEAVFALHWSPDGKHIVFQAPGDGRYVAVTPETGAWRDWHGVSGIPTQFSADGQHLLAMESTGVGMLMAYSLLELDAARDLPARRYVARSLAWSPAGHRLALANDLGVFLVDPDTGGYAWLRGGECRVAW